MTLSEMVNMLSNIAEIVVTIFLAYVVYRIARLIGTLDDKIKKETKT